MKLNISYGVTGNHKSFEVDDEKKLIPFYEKRIGQEVPADTIAPEFAGYVVRISGGNDKQGFPMMPGVMNRNRVRILFRPGMKCYRPRRDGCMKRKSVRGAIVGPYLSALNLVIVKKGEQEIEPLTTVSIPNVCQPKRAYRIRKMWNLPRDADPRPYLIKREVKNKAGEVIKVKVPKVQRLMTEQKLARKAKKEAKRRANLLLNRTRRKDYAEFKTKLLAERKAAAETATC